MDGSGATPLLAAALVLVNAFFVIAELAVVRVRASRLDELARRGSRAAAQARSLVQQLDVYLTACQLGVTMASLGLGWIGEPLVAGAIEAGLARLGVEPRGWHGGLGAMLALALITGVLVVLGELVPKMLAIRHAERITLWIAAPMSAFCALTRPAVTMLTALARRLVRPLGVPPDVDTGETHSLGELRALVSDLRRGRPSELSETELLVNAFDFPAHTVRQIMRPRGEVVYLSLQDSLEKTIETVRRTGYTRFPLCHSDLDEVVGVVHVKDLLFPPRPLTGPADLLALRHPAVFIPENVSVVALLAEMRRRRVLMALAVDEYGQVSGLCTMENVLEQLVGEIQDEHDHEAPQIQITRTGDFVVDGRMLISDVNEHLLTSFSAPGCETIGGLVTYRLGRLPRRGDTLEIEHFRVVVLDLAGFRISRLAFAPITPAA